MARLITEGFEAGHLEGLQTFGLDSVISGGAPNSGNGYAWSNWTGYSYVMSGFTLPEPYPMVAYIKFAFSARNYIVHVFNQDDFAIFNFRRSLTNPRVYDYFVDETLVHTGTAWIVEDAPPEGPNNWMTLEIKVDLSSPRIQVKVGGQLDFDWSGEFSEIHDNVNIKSVGVYHNDYYWGIGYDDIIVNDDTWPGDRRIIGLRPSGNGSHIGLTPSDIAKDNYELMNELVSGHDAHYVQSSTPGAYDLYALPNIEAVPSILDGYDAKRIIVEADARETVAEDGQSIRIGYKLNDTITWGDAEPVNTTWRHFKVEVPGSFDESEIDGLEIGVKVNS